MPDEEIRHLAMHRRRRNRQCRLAGRAVPSLTFHLRPDRLLLIDQVPLVDHHRLRASVPVIRLVSGNDATIGFHERLTLSGLCRARETTFDIIHARRICTPRTAEALLVSHRGPPCLLSPSMILDAINDLTHVGDHRMVEDLADIAEVDTVHQGNTTLLSPAKSHLMHSVNESADICCIAMSDCSEWGSR